MLQNLCLGTPYVPYQYFETNISVRRALLTYLLHGAEPLLKS